MTPHDSWNPGIYLCQQRTGWAVHWDCLFRYYDLPMDLRACYEAIKAAVPTANTDDLVMPFENRIGRVTCINQEQAKTIGRLMRKHLFGGRVFGRDTNARECVVSGDAIIPLRPTREKVKNRSRVAILKTLVSDAPKPMRIIDAEVTHLRTTTLRAMLSEMRRESLVTSINPRSKYGGWMIMDAGKLFLEKYK